MTIRGIQCSIISAHLYIVNWNTSAQDALAVAAVNARGR